MLSIKSIKEDQKSFLIEYIAEDVKDLVYLAFIASSIAISNHLAFITVDDLANLDIPIGEHSLLLERGSISIIE